MFFGTKMRQTKLKKNREVEIFWSNVNDNNYKILIE